MTEVKKKRKHKPPECGTRAGYIWHKKHGEPIDEPCRRAHTAYVDTWRRQNVERVLIHAKRRTARNRALARLAKLRPREYAELLAEEYQSEGIEP